MASDLEHRNEQVLQEEKPEAPADTKKHRALRLMLNSLIVCFLLVAGFFSYTYLTRSAIEPPPSPNAPVVPKPPHGIQLDVLNGCGVKGTAMKFTNFLRSNGFDVVEMKNYKTSHIPRTLVIDRVGDLANARHIAAVLGVSEQNVIQQLNPDYFVDVSVVIGDDYARMKPIH